MKHSRHRFHAAVSITAALFSLMLLNALWIPLKASLAQVLIARSWQALEAGQDDARPWPWADTRPLARLTVPRLNKRQYVLDANSGRNLAFGPSFSAGNAHSRDMVIHGHRDTHFDFLDQIKPGDLLHVERHAGTGPEIEWFEVVQTEIIDSRRAELVINPGIDRLSLVTCYPLNSARPGGFLRYVITALPATKESLQEMPSASAGLHLANGGLVITGAEHAGTGYESIGAGG